LNPLIVVASLWALISGSTHWRRIGGEQYTVFTIVKMSAEEGMDWLIGCKEGREGNRLIDLLQWKNAFIGGEATSRSRQLMNKKV
jgi:hypothetical protein